MHPLLECFDIFLVNVLVKINVVIKTEPVNNRADCHFGMRPKLFIVRPQQVRTGSDDYFPTVFVFGGNYQPALFQSDCSINQFAINAPRYRLSPPY